MANKVVVYNYFEGGWSTDARIGQKHSSAYIQGFDVRKSPSQMSVLPGPRREDAGIVKDLILDEVMVSTGKVIATGNLGYIYARTATGTWSNEGKMLTGAGGIDYRRDTDAVYLTSSKTVSSYSKITTNPVLLPDVYGSSYSSYDNTINMGFNVNANQTGGTKTTPILVATAPLSELNTAIRYFQTDIEPLTKISVFIVAKGTGDWTLTLHDGLNNVLGSATVLNANLNNTSFNDFVFSSALNGQVRAYPAPNARTYHIHVTSTVADGTVASTLANDLSTCDLQIWADRLVATNNGLHPIQRFLQFECIGNGNYLSIWEPVSDIPTNAEWIRHKLVFPQEFEVCGLATQNEFLVIAAERNTTGSLTPQGGVLFFWDGTSPTYNYFLEIPEGSPYALSSYKNVLTYYAGGDRYSLTSAQTLPVKIRHLPGADTEFTAVNASTSTVGATGNSLMATLTDNFNSSGSAPDLTKWAAFGNYSQSNGFLQLTSDLAAGAHGISSNAVYDLTGSQMQVRLANAGNQALASLEVYPMRAEIDDNNYVAWYVSGNTIKARTCVGGSITTIASTAYVATTFQFLRIRESAGTTYWDYSIDGVNWFNFASVANPIAMTALLAFLLINTFNVEASKTTVLLDDFNIIIGISPITIYPSAATVRRGIQLWAYPSATTNTQIPFGIYSYGSIDKNYSSSFSYNYTISTGSQYFSPQNNLQIGMVKAFGDILHISWRDDLNGGYGIDVVDNSSAPASTAIWRSMIVDNGYATKAKGGLFIEAAYSLPAGATITLAYQLDSSGTWISSPAYSTTNLWQRRAGYARFGIPSQFYELQAQIIVTTPSTATTPGMVTMAAIAYDDRHEEVLV